MIKKTTPTPSLAFIGHLKHEEFNDVATLLGVIARHLFETLEQTHWMTADRMLNISESIFVELDKYNNTAGAFKMVAAENIRKYGEDVLCTVYKLRGQSLDPESKPQTKTTKTEVITKPARMAKN